MVQFRIITSQNYSLLVNFTKFFVKERTFLTATFHKCGYKENTISKMTSALFEGQLDHHKGITIDTKDTTCSIDDFEERLDASLSSWKEENLRVSWFKVSLSDVHLIPILAKKGFKIHHAKNDVIALYLWLADNECSKVPHFAHNLVGAGAIVFNDKRQVLVVRERYRTMAFWKLPGGYVDPGEDISKAAMREVLEETSVKTKFHSLVSLRHILKAPFGCTDMYFVVRLEPLSTEIIKQDEEVEDCQWMDIDTYLSHPEVHETNRMFVQLALDNEKDGIIMKREDGVHPITKAPQFLFSLQKLEKK